MMNIMHVVNTASVGAMAGSMIFVTFLAAKSYLMISQLAKNSKN